MRNTSAANLFFIVISVLFCICYANGDVIYVDNSAMGGNNDGSNWGNAYLYLQGALTDASAGDQIWIAAGIYTPDKSNANPTGTGDRTASFVLKNLVEIHGGFAGGETSLEQRETDVDGAYVNVTYLSGDLLGDDDPGTLVQNLLAEATRAENSYHVITATLCGPPTILEGVTVIGGQANGTDELGKGGGWYNITNSSPTIERCIFTRNAATTRGGGWYNEGANCKPILTNVTFTMNYSNDRGGAVAMLNIGSYTIIDSCEFIKNYAINHGGSMYLYLSSPMIQNSFFSEDYASNGGSLSSDSSLPTFNMTSFVGSSGAYGGAVYMRLSQGAEFDSCVFESNTATNGGACNLYGGENTFSNCQFQINAATSNGGVVFMENGTPQFTACVFYQNIANSSAGVIYNYHGHPNIKSCEFVSNSCASTGGVIRNQSGGSGGDAYLTVQNSTFFGNNVSGSGSVGGVIANVGRVWQDGTTNRRSTFTYLTNCTFSNNVAVGLGGGIHSNYTTPYCYNYFKNCIVFGNADASGGNYSETAQIYGGANTVQYSCVQGLDAYAGNGNIGDDPLFADPLGPDWIGGTLDDNLRLAAGSPCIDAGNGLLVPADLLTDLDGFARCQDDPATVDTGIPATNPPHDPNGVPDMGAYEFSSIDLPQWCDDNLKAAVEDALDITNPTCLDMLNLTSLNISGKEITCLGGLECALNLTSLRANNNQIVDISPIAGCTKLQTLYLYSNNIEDISPLCSLVNLTYLHLAYNEITEIPTCLCNLNQLRNLYLYNNPISDICPATCFTTLRTFHAYNIVTLPLNAYQVCIPQIKTNNPNLTDFRYDAGCVTMLEADVNDDCIVDLLDFAQLCSEWLSCTHMYPEMCP